MQTTNYKLQTTNGKGFTLIEALTLLFVFSVIAMTFFQTYATGTRLIIESKNRLGATALANQKMEIIRSIDYATIGTKHWNGSAWVYGIPAGDLLEDEVVNVNSAHYAVHTFVQYVDDAFDGKTGGSPADAIPNDYKRVRLTVAWGGGGEDQSISLFANISPNGIETSAGGGVLSINIIDASGSGVPSVTAHIVNSSTGVDVTTTTDVTGNITLPGTPASTQKYIITASRSGYYGAVTYPPYPTSTYSPVDEHASVVDGVLNQKTIVIDRASDILVHTKDPFGTDIPDIGIDVSGGRILGTNPDLSLVYGFAQVTSTDGSGNKTFGTQSYGLYKLSVTSPRYELYKFSPEEVTTTEFGVVAGSNKEVTAVLLDSQIGSVRVTVTNQADGSPIPGADVHLSNTSLGYDVTQTTDQYGFIYFPKTLPGLANGTYDIAVSAAGFSSQTGTVSIDGSLRTETLSLTSN
ncbi:MAG: carboxypeptidase regulatory-like domain-containing protein [Candidatus Moraniibacteriota bacterium]